MTATDWILLGALWLLLIGVWVVRSAYRYWRHRRKVALRLKAMRPAFDDPEELYRQMKSLDWPEDRHLW